MLTAEPAGELTRISHQVAMRMMKKDLFLNIYANFSNGSPGQTARSRALAGLFTLSAHMRPQT